MPEYTYPGSASFNWPGGAVGAVLPNPISFPEVKNVPNWKDISPRLGGDVGCVRQRQDGDQGFLRPLRELRDDRPHEAEQPGRDARREHHRSWNDSSWAGDPRTGNYIPDCNLLNPALNGECGPFLNSAFGTSVVNTRYASDVTSRLAPSAEQQPDFGGACSRSCGRASG